MTTLDLVTGSFQELGIYNAADVLSGEDAALGLTLLNDLLDEWNADRQAVYADVFSSFTLTPNLQPHTIGVAANAPTFAVSGNRPESIDGASLVLTTVTPNVYLPLHLRDAQWYDAQTVPTLATSVPTDLYYNPTWPNGSLYLLPIPTTAYGIRLLTRTVLAQLTLVTVFTLPPGYQTAIKRTLAENLCGPMQVAVPPLLPMKAMQARAKVFANNTVTPKLATRDSGMPGGRQGGSFNYLSGLGR